MNALRRTLASLIDLPFVRPQPSAFVAYMRAARDMMRAARANLAEDCPLAARAAVESALAYRAAAHASRRYA